MKKLACGLFTLSSILVFACGDDHDHGSDKPSLAVALSGGEEATGGFVFPPTSPNDLVFVDGWQVRFDRILVTVDDITLSENPDTSPTDQSQAGGVVARAKGPWAVDMTRHGAATEISTQTRPLADDDHDHEGHDHGSEGKDDGAQSIVHFESLEGGKSFDLAQRYAFGFQIVTASDGAKKTNLDAASAADYAEMVSKGIAVLYVGTATFKGGASCTSSDPAYPFGELPTTVKFRFGFRTPTQYINCQNTDLRGKAFDGEEAQRGIQLSPSGETVAHITLHVDHPFWNTVDHDAAELFFDQMAAAANADGTLVLDDLSAFDFTSFKDKAGRNLPWRSCVADKPAKSGTRSFDPGSVAVNPTASEDAALRHYGDYVRYQQSTQGHLNADGLCAVKRNFPSPR